MSRFFALLVLVVAAFAGAALPAAAQQGGADLYQQAEAAYDATDYTRAASLYEQAIQAGYTRVVAYYKLGLAYRQLRRYDEALWAFETALQVDPTYNQRSKIDEFLADVRSKGSGRAQTPAWAGGALVAATARPAATAPGAAPTTVSAPAPSTQEIAAALRSQPVFVAPAMAPQLGPEGVQRLTAVATEAAGQGYQLRFVLVPAAPAPYRGDDLAPAAQALIDDLGLDRGIVVMASTRGAAAASRVVDQSTLRGLVRGAEGAFATGGFAGGLERIARDVMAEAQRRQAEQEAEAERERQAAAQGRIALVIFVALLAAGWVGWRLSRRARLVREAQAALASVQPLVSAVSDDLPYLQDNEAGRRAQELAAAGIQRYREAAEAVEAVAAEPALAAALPGWGGARRLQAARAAAAQAADQLNLARVQAQRSLHGLEPAPEEAPAAASREAACFFCAKPLAPGEAQAVEIELDGQRRRVFADPEHAAEVARGTPPPIRTVEREGRQRPWFSDPTFDPRRDYQPVYTGMSWTDLLMWSWLFNELSRPREHVVVVDRDYGGSGGGGWSGEPATWGERAAGAAGPAPGGWGAGEPAPADAAEVRFDRPEPSDAAYVPFSWSESGGRAEGGDRS